MRSLAQKIFLASAITAMAALTTSSALAEMKVNVPFSFTANGKVCPAGEYSIGRYATQTIVTLRSEDGRGNFQWVLSSGDPAPNDTRVILRFDKVGDNYTLQSVQYHNLITARLDGKKHNSEAPTRLIVGQ